MGLVKSKRLKINIKVISLVNKELVIKGEVGTVIDIIDNEIVVHFPNSCVYLHMNTEDVILYEK